MNRREALSRTAILLGGALSASTIAAVMGGCKADPKALPSSTFLSAAQEQIVSTMCDIILPKTQTPSATEAGVPSFIYRVMQHCWAKEEREAWTAGLAKLDKEAKGIQQLSDADKVAFLKKLDTDARSAAQQQGAAADPAHTCWRQLKELTVVGYFTSEIGASEVLEYVPQPGRWEPCIPLAEGQRAWAE